MWEKLGQQYEAKTYWTVRHDILLRQYWAAYQSKDKEAIERMRVAINNFNEEIKGSPARGYVITSDSIRKSLETRARNRALQEQGVPMQRRDIPLFQDIQRLHPGAQPIGRQRVQ